jgi:hypothetical protein
MHTRENIQFQCFQVAFYSLDNAMQSQGKKIDEKKVVNHNILLVLMDHSNAPRCELGHPI